MARVPYFDISQATGRAKATYDAFPPLNVMRMMGHTGDLVAAFGAMASHLLQNVELDVVLKEIAIVRVGVLSNSAYELHHHRRILAAVGASQDVVDAVTEGPDAKAFDDVQRLVMRFVDDVVANVRASDATFTPLAKHLSVRELQELTLTIGCYMMIARFLETFDVDIEDEDPLAGRVPGAPTSAD